MHNDLLWSPMVVDFGTDRKRLCDFLLVVRSKTSPILARLKDRAY